jgi:hypothetical protein
MRLSSGLRVLAATATVALTSAALAAPAWADDGRSDSTVVDQSPTVMSAGQATLMFVGIPLLVFALVWILVSAPGWTRNGRANAGEAFAGDPVVVGGGAAEAPTEIADAVDEGTGGTSARW